MDPVHIISTDNYVDLKNLTNCEFDFEEHMIMLCKNRTDDLYYLSFGYVDNFVKAQNQTVSSNGAIGFVDRPLYFKQSENIVNFKEATNNSLNINEVEWVRDNIYYHVRPIGLSRLPNSRDNERPNIKYGITTKNNMFMHVELKGEQSFGLYTRFFNVYLKIRYVVSVEDGNLVEDGDTPHEIITFDYQEDLIEREQRIYLISKPQEGQKKWLTIHTLWYSIFDSSDINHKMSDRFYTIQNKNCGDIIKVA
jgi:hypothetical protein